MLLSDLRGKHDGATIYVLGSGKSVEFYDPEFFSDKLIVATNHGWSNWLPRVNYMVTKYHQIARDWCKSERLDLLIVSRGQSGQLNELIEDSDDWIVFEHEANKTADFGAQHFPHEGLVVSYSTITSAMHLAAFMGARHIVMVGADCGWLDDDSRVTGHPGGLRNREYPLYFDIQNRIVADILRTRFGCSVSSMLPFVTPNMEGHKFVSPFGALNA